MRKTTPVDKIPNECFPLFNLNWYEKWILRRVKKRYEDFCDPKKPMPEYMSEYLCTKIMLLPFTKGFRKKINKAIRYHNTLGVYLLYEYRIDYDDQVYNSDHQVRLRWIKLLLEHNKQKD